MFRIVCFLTLMIIFAWSIAFGTRPKPVAAEPVHDQGGIAPEQIKHACAMCRNCCNRCNTQDLCCCHTSDRCTCKPDDPTRDPR